MACVSDIYNALREIAPTEYALDFDNPGHLVGDAAREVSRITVALDATGSVIQEAVENWSELIITHHPLIFHKLSSVLADDPVGGRVMRLIENGISLICMHTNLDAAHGGVNDALAEAIGLKELSIIEVLGEDGGKEYGIGRVGELENEESLGDFLKRVKSALNAPGLRFAASEKKSVKKVAVGGGSCSSYLEDVHCMGCDAFVTADVKHDGFLLARELGITLVDAGHFSTEDVVSGVIARELERRFPQVEVCIAQANRAPEEYFTGE